MARAGVVAVVLVATFEVVEEGVGGLAVTVTSTVCVTVAGRLWVGAAVDGATEVTVEVTVTPGIVTVTPGTVTTVTAPPDIDDPRGVRGVTDPIRWRTAAA